MPFELKDFAAAAGVDSPDSFVENCGKLRSFLEEINRSVNLTRITGKEEFELKHAADSLLFCIAFPELKGKTLKLADIGCGAGFPSLILAMARPEWQITAIDSIGKKINFVRQAAEILKLKNLTALQGRSIELNRKPEFQGKFDIVTARAVAPSPKLYRETDKFPIRGGKWIFFKTPGQAEEELPELEKIRNMHWELTNGFELPENAGVRLFVKGVRK